VFKENQVWGRSEWPIILIPHDTGVVFPALQELIVLVVAEFYYSWASLAYIFDRLQLPQELMYLLLLNLLLPPRCHPKLLPLMRNIPPLYLHYLLLPLHTRHLPLINHRHLLHLPRLPNTQRRQRNDLFIKLLLVADEGEQDEGLGGAGWTLWVAGGVQVVLTELAVQVARPDFYVEGAEAVLSTGLLVMH
jgi:hypothetical protein